MQMIPAIAEDGARYPIEKLAAHQKPILHAAVSIFVYSGEHLLLQRRAAGKYHSALKWANTCCTHPHWGESPEGCAHRRMVEELGFTTPLSAAGHVTYKADVGSGLWEHEEVSLFVGEADRKTLSFTPNPDEVAEVRWITVEALEAEIREAPDTFSEWLKIYLAERPAIRQAAAGD